MKYVWLPVFLLVVFLIPIRSQQPLSGWIQGRIVDQKSMPVAYADLTATNIDSVEPESHRRTTGADQNGFYEFVDVPPGHYSLAVQRNGYRDYTLPLVTVHPGETVKIPEIKLAPADSR